MEPARRRADRRRGRRRAAVPRCRGPHRVPRPSDVGHQGRIARRVRSAGARRRTSRSAAGARARDRTTARDVSAGHELRADPRVVHLRVDARATLRRAREAGPSGNPFEQVLGTILRRVRPDHVAPVVTFDATTTRHDRRPVERAGRQGRSRRRAPRSPARRSSRSLQPVEPASTATKRGQARRRNSATATRAPCNSRYGPIAARTTKAQVPALAREARAILGHSLQVTSSGHTFAVTPRQIASALTTRVDGARIDLAVDPRRLEAALRPQLGPIGAPRGRRELRSDATTTGSSWCRRDGQTPDLAAVATRHPRQPLGDRGAARRRHPTHDTAWAPTARHHRTGLAVHDELRARPGAGHQHPSCRRHHEQHRRRTRTRLLARTTPSARAPRRGGFVKAPVYYEEFTEDFGGGVSQVATTTYNAAFWGGFEIVVHQPHTIYYSRYPLGRRRPSTTRCSTSSGGTTRSTACSCARPTATARSRSPSTATRGQGREGREHELLDNRSRRGAASTSSRRRRTPPASFRARRRIRRSIPPTSAAPASSRTRSPTSRRVTPDTTYSSSASSTSPVTRRSASATRGTTTCCPTSILVGAIPKGATTTKPRPDHDGKPPPTSTTTIP